MDKEIGWIKLHRTLSHHWVSEDPLLLALWVRFLLEAYHKTTPRMLYGKLVQIERGQFVFGLEQFVKKTGIKREVLRNRIILLETTGLITRTRHPKYSIITIKNYNEHQQDNSLINTQTTRRHDDKTQQYKNVKNVKNVKNFFSYLPRNEKEEEEFFLLAERDLGNSYRYWEAYEDFKLYHKAHEPQTDNYLKAFKGWVVNGKDKYKMSRREINENITRQINAGIIKDDTNYDLIF